jgi:hypothetical protein
MTSCHHRRSEKGQDRLLRLDRSERPVWVDCSGLGKGPLNVSSWDTCHPAFDGPTVGNMVVSGNRETVTPAET